MPVPLTDIEAAAEKAQTGYPDGSPGPWVRMADADGMPGVWSSAARDFVCSDLTGLDANYIATADPPTVLALCEALRIAVEQGAHDPNCNLDIVACDCWLAAVRELVDLGGEK